MTNFVYVASTLQWITILVTVVVVETTVVVLVVVLFLSFSNPRVHREP